MIGMFKYEVRGYFVDGGKVVPFVLVTPPCQNTYQAAIYAEGKYHGYDLRIDHDNIARILE